MEDVMHGVDGRSNDAHYREQSKHDDAEKAEHGPTGQRKAVGTAKLFSVPSYLTLSRFHAVSAKHMISHRVLLDHDGPLVPVRRSKPLLPIFRELCLVY